MNLSKKAENIQPSLTLEITAKAKAMKQNGIDVIGFGAGEPDFNTPKNIQDAAIRAIQSGHTKYTAASGIIELKRAIVNKFKKDNNISYNENQIIISTGGKQCLANAFMAILNEGDEVIVSTPYWVSYPELIRLSGGKPIEIITKEENNFKYDINELEKIITNKTKAIVINTPNNPTGTVYSRDELIKIAEFCKKHDLLIISDEMYENLIYDNVNHISIASLSKDAYERTITLGGVSKSYAMTGWRIGYAAANETIIKYMSNIQSHTTSNPNTIAQYAALEALSGSQDDMKHMIKEFHKRRDYMVDKINSINNISCLKPQGAFYVMLNISKLLDKKIDGEIIENSMNFSKKLLDKKNVAVIPGEAFGVKNFVRLSYATSMENIINGLNRIEKFIGDDIK